MNAEMGEGHVARRLGQEGSNLMGDPKFSDTRSGQSKTCMCDLCEDLQERVCTRGYYIYNEHRDAAIGEELDCMKMQLC